MKRFGVAILALLLLAAVILGAQAIVTRGVARAEQQVNGSLETLGSGDNQIKVLYVWGTPYEMGYARGLLLRSEINQWLALTGGLMMTGMGVSEQQVDAAYDLMAPYVPDEYKEEMRGLADGAGLDLKAVHRMHTIPELSEYHCSAFGAWGPATGDGHVYQIRALDYATEAGIQTAPCITVSKPNDGHIFANVGWVGMLGVVSGLNAEQIAMSEIGDSFGNQHERLDGEPMIFLMRDVLQHCGTLQEAIERIQNTRRTSSYLYVVSDGKAGQSRGFQTAADFCNVYDDTNLQPFPEWRLPGVVFWGMAFHVPKYSGGLYEVLKRDYGHINGQTGMDAMHIVKTGNLHAVSFDATALQIWVANAGVDETPAYDREFLHFDLAAALQKFPQ